MSHTSQPIVVWGIRWCFCCWSVTHLETRDMHQRLGFLVSSWEQRHLFSFGRFESCQGSRNQASGCRFKPVYDHVPSRLPVATVRTETRPTAERFSYNLLTFVKYHEPILVRVIDCEERVACGLVEFSWISDLMFHCFVRVIASCLLVSAIISSSCWSLETRE
jgi:hypothetical protein